MGTKKRVVKEDNSIEEVEQTIKEEMESMGLTEDNPVRVFRPLSKDEIADLEALNLSVAKSYEGSISHYVVSFK